MNWAEYVLQKPKTLEERRLEASAQFRKEKRKEYFRKRRAAKRVELKEKNA